MDTTAIGQWIDMIGPVTEARIYEDGVLLETGAKVTLPAITNQTAEFRAAGALTLPITGSFEAMEMTITKKGTDEGLQTLCAQRFHDIEVRYMQDVKTVTGESRMMPCKAFVHCFPRVAYPQTTIEPGSIIETEITYDVTRYESIQDGKRVVLVDKLKYIMETGGTDYTQELREFFAS